MSTVNFSVPEDVKQAFNETFQGRNKSATMKPSRGYLNGVNMPLPSPRSNSAQRGKKGVRDPDGGCRCRTEMVSAIS